MISMTSPPLSKTTSTILITGASSEMGSALIRQLSNFSSLKIRAMVHRSLVNVPGCEIRPGNLKNLDLLARAVFGVDIVVHMAALTKSSRDSDYFDTNVNGTKNLIDTCVKQGVKKIIYISSLAASISGGAYASSKLEAEQCVKNSGLKWLILRPSEVYGQGHDTINQLFQWVQSYACVPVIGAGKSRLSPVHIDDVVSAIAGLILIEKVEYKTIILAGPEEIIYDDLVDRIAAYFNVKRFKLHLPTGLVKLAAKVMSGIGINILVPDQIPRLLSEKNYDIDVAREILNYSPCCLEDGMKKIFIRSK